MSDADVKERDAKERDLQGQDRSFQDQQSKNNNNPMEQPVDIKSVQQTDPKDPWGDKNDGRNAGHLQVQQSNSLSESGKDIGLVHAPITSIHPTSNSTLGSDKAKDNIVKVAKPNRFLNDEHSPQYAFEYPFEDTEMGAGFFIPLEAGQTTDALMAKLHKQIYQLQQKTGECEKDEKGDDVWESVVIQTKKRKDDVIQLASDGKPIVGANQTNRPKLIHSINFLLRPVVKGDDMGEGVEAESDGVLAIRVL
jgi:hypothetical protein